MGDDPRDYDKHFTTSAGRNSRRRIGIDLNQGEVTRFLVQLEYLVDPIADDWEIVVRYDHDSEGSAEATHNVTKEGLHIDIYREGEKHATHELTPPISPNRGLNAAEEHLTDHLQGYIQRFEKWHGMNHNNP